MQMDERLREISAIATSARMAIESWGIQRDEGLCAIASGYLHCMLRKAGYPARVISGYLRCDRPQQALRTRSSMPRGLLTM
jgi:hypothetical protein